jgi:8-amino-7-oxononanoate synthase
MAAELDELAGRALHRVRRRVRTGQSTRVRLGRCELINFASNDYLNLAGDPRLARAARRAGKRWGVGAGASPLVAGYLPPHRSLERALAAFEGEEAALLFSSGFAANLAVLGSMAGPGDAIFSDRLNHASLIDGCRLSRADTHIYEHADANHLEALLRRHGGKARRRVIVTDAIFSMDGDLAPLADIATLAARFDATVVVDEAHATGVLGPRGRGLSATIAVPEGVAWIKVGTLSKALGSQGGFVAGPRMLIDWLVNRARPYIFSTALAVPSAAAARRALRIVQAEPDRRAAVLARAAELVGQLTLAGIAVPPAGSPIMPLIVGEPADALRISSELQTAGFLVPAIRPPSVPDGMSRLRISVSSGHSEQDIRALCAALVACRDGSPAVATHCDPPERASALSLIR